MNMIYLIQMDSIFGLYMNPLSKLRKFDFFFSFFIKSDTIK